MLTCLLAMPAVAGAGNQNIALLDIGDLSPELAASLVTLQLTVDQQAEQKVDWVRVRVTGRVHVYN